MAKYVITAYIVLKIGLGEYQLHSSYKSAARSVDELNLIKCYSLNEVVTCVLDNCNINQGMKEEDTSNDETDTLKDGNNCTGKLYFTFAGAKIELLCMKVLILKKEILKLFQQCLHLYVVQGWLCVKICIAYNNNEFFCRFIVDQGLISHNQNLGVFTMKGTTGNAHAIHLFPNESCSCPATGRCYHILHRAKRLGLQIAN